MKLVDSGSGKIPYITMLAILSISLVVNLPGLAISPIEGKLSEVFPHVSDLQIQLLEVLPNFVVIPFILLAGKICTEKNQMFILGLGLALYTLTGVLYFFADTMVELILLGCVLGVGCGLVIPLAASLISQYFSGEARAKTLGLKSGVSNVTVIFATLFVGWIAEISWHLSFIVYMLPLVPLCLIPFMNPNFIKKYSQAPTAAEAAAAAAADSVPATDDKAKTDTKSDAKTDAAKAEAEKKPDDRPVEHAIVRLLDNRSLMMLAGVIALYIVVTYASIIVSYFLPFTMQHYRLDSGEVGVATAMFYLAASGAGFTLPYVKRAFGERTIQAAILMIVVGLYLTAVFHSNLTYILFTFVVGFGYGTIQPIIYDKTTDIAPTKAASTRYFAYLLTGNYIGIAIVPFVVDTMARLFNATNNTNFSYILNGSVMVVVLLIAFWQRKSFTFSINPAFLKKNKKS